MPFKVVKQLNPIGATKTLMEPNCNLCMEQLLTILKKQRGKRVTIMNKNLEIYGACSQKTTFHRFFISTDDLILSGERVRPLKGFQILGLEPVNGHFCY